MYENPPKVGILSKMYSKIMLGDVNAFEYARHAAAWVADILKQNDDWESTMYNLPPPTPPTRFPFYSRFTL
jgi:hypothetical protein